MGVTSSSEIFTRSLLLTVLIVLCMLLVAISGLLDDDRLHIGHEYYAEVLRFPSWDVMPLNTLVNLGYIVVGVYWFGTIKVSFSKGILSYLDACFFYTFNNMACVYGTVSIIRMVTQKAAWAILDRWFTLLVFGLVPLWTSHIRNEYKFKTCVITMSVSVLSYFYTLIMPDFYEIIVGLHILRAIHGGCMAYSKHRSPHTMLYFLAAIGSCILFVCGNLFDMELPAFSRIFNYISGHAISRMFDASQIHFTNLFFYDLTLQKMADLKGENKKGIAPAKKLSKCVGTDISYENPILMKQKTA